MEDKRWTTKDKLEQFRGVTSLYNSTITNIKDKTIAQRKKQTKDIKNLTTQNNKFRQQYEQVLTGDKTNLLPVLNAYPKMQLAFKNLNPQDIEEKLKQSIFCKNKELDRLRYQKKNLEEVFLKKKLKLVELQEKAEDPENYLWEQEIANQIHSVSVKQNAAHNNRIVYEKALNILQKDAIRFDEVLDGLRKDLIHQCQSIVKAVEMGQSVTEDLNQLQQEYKATEKAVRNNMKQRDRAIRGLRADLDNIRLQAHAGGTESGVGLHDSPLRHDSPAGIDDNSGTTNEQTLIELNIRRHITTNESILNQIREAALVHRVEDICPRMEEQKIQKARLQRQVKENEEQLAKMLDLHNQLDVNLEVVMYHTMTEEAMQLKEDKIQLYNDIEMERDNLMKAREDFINLGEKIVDIRTALLTLNIMLDTVWETDEESGIELGLSLGSDMLQIKPLYQLKTEALTLMEQVTKKVRWLVDQVGSREIPDKPMVATHFAAESAITILGVEDEADNIVSDMLDELEDMDDPSVLTRKYIKAESQRIVNLYDNPRAMFQDDKQPKYRKHKCF